MKKMYISLKGLLLPFFGFCQHFTPFNHYDMKLKTTSVQADEKLYIFYQTEGREIIDSATLDNGSFHLTGEVSKPLPATLVLDVNNEGYKSIMKKRGPNANVLQFYLHAGNIIAATNRSLSETQFIVSDINKDFKLFNAELKKIFLQEVKLSRALVAERDTAKLKHMERKYDSLKMERMPILKKFILTHPNSFISLVALKEYHSRLQGMDDYELTNPHRAISKDLFRRLDTSVQNSIDGRDFARQFSNTQLLAVGEIAPDFTQPDVNGKQVTLSGFKVQYVLIDFWASWCGPCRQNNPALVKLYKEFSGRNFTILGISLDDNEGRAAWLKAIKDDGLLWTQVSDLKHWDNAVAKLYTIAAIPQSILVGPNGKIILNGTSEVELEAKLNQLLPVK